MSICEKYGIKAREFTVTDSTNEQAKIYAKSGEWDGEIIAFIAEEQTAGRGRYSRKFYSKSGAGAYLSLLFKPKTDINDTTPIIALAAVSMIKAIEKLSEARPMIKWVNDIILGDRKLGGILIEGSINPDTRKYDYLIAGIGINLYSTEMEEEIRDIATSLEDEAGIKIDKDELIQSFIEMFTKGLSTLEDDELFEEYKIRLLTLGKDVTVKSVTEEYEANAIALNRDYSLTVVTKNGDEKRIYTGEVSIRAKE